MTRQTEIVSVDPKSQPIISVSGLRGLVGSQLTPLVVARYVSAFCSKLEGDRVVIARDGRESGPMLAQAVTATLMANGCQVLDAGVAATPTVGVLVRALGAAGGIQISASHNPVEYNGLKLFSSEGRVLPAHEGKKVLEAYRAGQATWNPVHSIGSYTPIDSPHDEHLKRVLAAIAPEPIRKVGYKVFLSSNHGAGSLLGRKLLESLGTRFDIGGDTPDGRFAYPPEPIEENLRSVSDIVREGDTRSDSAKTQTLIDSR